MRLLWQKKMIPKILNVICFKSIHENSKFVFREDLRWATHKLLKIYLKWPPCLVLCFTWLLLCSQVGCYIVTLSRCLVLWLSSWAGWRCHCSQGEGDFWGAAWHCQVDLVNCRQTRMPSQRLHSIRCHMLFIITLTATCSAHAAPMSSRRAARHILPSHHIWKISVHSWKGLLGKEDVRWWSPIGPFHDSIWF